MGLTQSKLAVGDLIFDARLCGPEGRAVVVLLRGWPEFSSWWQDSLEALEAALLAEGARRLRAAFDPRVPKDLVDEAAQRLAEPGALSATLNWYRAVDDDLYVPAGEVRVPTLYWGENDMALGEDAAMRTKDFVKAPHQFVRLAGHAHWLPNEGEPDPQPIILAHLRAYD